MLSFEARAARDAVTIWRQDFIATLPTVVQDYLISGLARLVATHGVLNLQEDRSWFYIEGNRVMGVFTEGMSRSRMDEVDHLCRSYCDSFVDVFQRKLIQAPEQNSL